MDLLSFLPHAGVVVAIVGVTTLVKASALGALLGKWVVLLPVALGIALGIPVSFALGQTQWYWLIINPFLQAAGATYLWKIGKTVVEKA